MIRLATRNELSPPRGLVARQRHSAGGAAVAGFALTCALATIAHADTSTDRVVARSLFEQGRELMAAGNLAEACPKLAESQRLDPAGGTLLNLAACHQKEGRTATAWSEFNDALALAKHDARADRAKVAEERIAQLTPILSRLTIRMTKGVEVTGLVAKLDGVVVGAAVLGTALPVDPGTHEIEAGAPGKRRWTTKVELGRSSDNKTVDIPALEDSSSAPVPATSRISTPVPSDTTSASPTATATSAPPSQPSTSKRTVGFIVGGVGIAALGVGTVFGLRALSKWSDAKSHCPSSDACEPDAASLKDSATSAAWISDIGLGLGVVGLAVGTYLVVTGSKGSEPTSGQLHVNPVVASGGGGLALSGGW